MSTEVQFDEDPISPLRTMNSSVSAYEQRLQQKKADSPFIFRLLVRIHLVKNEKQAQIVLLVVSVVCIILAIFFIRHAITPPPIQSLEIPKKS